MTVKLELLCELFGGINNLFDLDFASGESSVHCVICLSQGRDSCDMGTRLPVIKKRMVPYQIKNYADEDFGKFM